MAKTAWKRHSQDFMLLAHTLSGLGRPPQAQQGEDRLPQSLRFLPLTGLASGLLLWAASRALFLLPKPWEALLLLALDLVCGNGWLLGRLMAMADGRPQTVPIAPQPNQEQERSQGRLAGPGGIIAGILCLLLLYGAYTTILSLSRVGNGALIIAPVWARWLPAWLLYAFPGLAPGRLRQGFDKSCFICSSCLAGFSAALFASPALAAAAAAASLSAWLPALARRRYRGGLEDSFCLAAAIWGQTVFLWAWIGASMLF